MFWSKASLLAALLAASTDAFVTPSPRRGVASFGGVATRQPLFVASEETAEETVAPEEVVEEVAEDAVAAATEVAEEVAAVVEEVAASSEDDEEKRSVVRPRHTIFVGNLPFDMTESSIKDLFDQHGKVDLVSLPKNRETGQPRGFAFVDMNTPEEMKAAIAAMDGQTVNGRVVRASESVPKDEAGGDRQSKPVFEKPQLPEGYKKIYVGNIPFDCTREEILEIYQKYGDVTEVYIPRDANTGNGRGFAFVTMEEDKADQAIEETNGQEMGGRKLVVSLPLPPGKKAPARDRAFAGRTKLYIGNLSFYTVKDTLLEMFEEFGTVHDCYLPEDPSTGGSRGFGFVTLDKEVASTAIAELDGCEVDGRVIRVNEAQPKRRRNYDDEEDEE